MAGLGRSKNGVASLAYDPPIHVFGRRNNEDVDARDKRAHDGSKLQSSKAASSPQPHVWRMTKPYLTSVTLSRTIFLFHYPCPIATKFSQL